MTIKEAKDSKIVINLFNNKVKKRSKKSLGNKKLSVILPCNVKYDGYYKKAYDLVNRVDNCYNLDKIKLWVQENIIYGSYVLSNLKEDIDTLRKEVSDLEKQVSKLQINNHGYKQKGLSKFD